MRRAGTAASGSGAFLCAEKEEVCGVGWCADGIEWRMWANGREMDDAALGRGDGVIADAVYAHERRGRHACEALDGAPQG